MGPDEERAAAFARWYDEQVCTRIESWRFGTQYVDEEFPHESDANFIRLDAVPDTASPETVVVATDVVLAESRAPRRVVIGTIQLADRLSVAFETAGWTMHRYLLLVRTADEPLPRSDVHCEEISLGSFLRFRASFGGASASRSYLEKVQRRVGGRYFVATIHGRPASGCVLWAHERDAQIEAVTTAPAMRGHGAGSAAVAAAIKASSADWIHLYTEAAAGPLPFYKSLGFDIAGTIAECTQDPEPAT
jgi:GNAT superfamily N-acetyltransferase